MTARRLAGALVVACLAAAPATTLAQDGNAPAAEELFKAGKTLLKEGRVDEACAKFAASNKLDPGMGILLYLGDCYEQAGRVASAWAAFEDAVARARSRGDTEREKIATDRSAKLAKRLPKVTVNVVAANRGPGFVVEKDGTPLDDATWGVPLPLDPGEHVFEARRPGKRTWRTEVKIEEGKAAEVNVPELADDTTTPPHDPPIDKPKAPGPIVPAPPDEPAPFWNGQRVAGLVVGAVGLAGVGVGIGLGVKTIGDWSTAQDHCDDGDPARCDADGVAAGEDAKTAGIASTVGFAVGGAAMATGLIVFFTAGRGKSDADAATDTAVVVPVPVVGRDELGLMLQGSF